MKKLILSFVFGLLAFSSFAMQATVVSTKGKAEVQNGSSWVALKNGDTLDQGSVIQTGFKSEVVLKIKESTVTVAPLSRITLQTLAEREGVAGAQPKDETSIYLDTGSLKSNVQKSADRRVGFTVRSPVATASVRGTEFDYATRYKSVALKTTGGKVAFWKNTKQSEAALDNAAANPDLPAEEAGVGNEPGDISDYAPPTAIVVSRGEDAGASVGSGMKSPAQVAHSGAVSLGAGTKSAATAERPASAFGGGEPSTKSAATTGSLEIEVVYE
ncbi:MAG: FecR domain-containing protein [Treponema sp.]|nr:FecR domain-containing protein [Treponema sp.]